MKKQWFVYSFVALFTIFALTSLTSIKERKFYYAFNEKTPLISQENILLVKFTKEFDRVNMENFLKDSVTGIQIKWHNPFVVEISSESLTTIEDLKLKLKSQENITSCHPFYKSEDGVDMGVTDEILIRFLPDVSDKQQKELHDKFNTEVIKETKIYQKLICPKGGDALEIANAYFKTGLVEFSTPDFISYPELFQTLPNDTYFGYQITCHNTGQTFNDGHSGTNDADIDAPEAWEVTTGSSDVIIAVLDEGVTSDHPDLPNTRQVRLNGSDFTSGDNDPSPVGNENHGNACAGVIAATMNNNQGIAGIAPDCKIMPIRMMDKPPSVVADAIEFAVDNGADILSNSWGWWTSNPNRYPVVVTAINYAINNDRVLIFAAGNTAIHDENNDGYVTFPANVNIQGVITVGSSDRDDQQANYSPTSDWYSQNNQIIDIVAPSHRAWPCRITGETKEMWTIDIPDSAGYNPWPDSGSCDNPPPYEEELPNSGTNYLSYTGRFGGTSHSCPVVAAVAALVLSIDQSFTYLEVFDILTTTADEVGGYTYTNGWSEELGYGRVNAFSAVCEAYRRTMSITGSSLVCTSNSTFTLHDRPQGDVVSWTKGSYLSYVSGQDTDNYTVKASSSSVSGSSWVKATITSECCTVTIQKDIWVGRPEEGYDHLINYYGVEEDEYCPYDVFGFTLIHDNPTYAVSYYDWEIDGSPSTTTSPCKDVYTGDEGYKDLYVEIRNACGHSDEYVYPYTVTDEACEPGEKMVEDWYFTIHPNPADNYIEINIFGTDEPYEIQIYNSINVLLYQKVAKKPVLKVNTAKFKNGTYFVHCLVGKEAQVLQLVISH